MRTARIETKLCRLGSISLLFGRRLPRVLKHVLTLNMKGEGGYQISGKTLVSKLCFADRTGRVSLLGNVDS